MTTRKAMSAIRVVGQTGFLNQRLKLSSAFRLAPIRTFSTEAMPFIFAKVEGGSFLGYIKSNNKNTYAGHLFIFIQWHTYYVKTSIISLDFYRVTIP